MKILALDGTITEKPHPLDKAFPATKNFHSTILERRDGIHFFVQVNGQTDHVLIPRSELQAHVEKNCPHFCPPPKSAPAAQAPKTS